MGKNNVERGLTQGRGSVTLGMNQAVAGGMEHRKHPGQS